MCVIGVRKNPTDEEEGGCGVVFSCRGERVDTVCKTKGFLLFFVEKTVVDISWGMCSCRKEEFSSICKGAFRCSSRRTVGGRRNAGAAPHRGMWLRRNAPTASAASDLRCLSIGKLSSHILMCLNAKSRFFLSIVPPSNSPETPHR